MRHRSFLLLAGPALLAPAAFGTVILAVGTRDGLLVCEDRRLTITSSTGEVRSRNADKAQQLGKFAFFAIAGDVSARVANVFGQSATTFDLLSAIPAFFQAHDVQTFDEPMALEFESGLREQLKRKPVLRPGEAPRAQTEVLLYWMDRSGESHFYSVDLSGVLSDQADGADPAHPAGHFVSPGQFRTSRLLAWGKGSLGYQAIAGGKDPALDDLRHDEELVPFLSGFVDSASVDSIAAVRSLKKLIRAISDRQQSIHPGGLDVSPESDCFLGTTDGIKRIDQ